MLERRVRFLINTPQVLIQSGGCSPTPRLEKLVLGAPERCGLLGDAPWLTVPLGVSPVTSAVVYVGVAVGCHPSEAGPALTAWSLEQDLVCCSLSCLLCVRNKVERVTVGWETPRVSRRQLREVT